VNETFSVHSPPYLRTLRIKQTAPNYWDNNFMTILALEILGALVWDVAPPTPPKFHGIWNIRKFFPTFGLGQLFEWFPALPPGQAVELVRNFFPDLLFIDALKAL
jgi:hypothetical protein